MLDFVLFLESFFTISYSSTQCSQFPWDLFVFLPQNIILKRQGQPIVGMKEKEEKFLVGGLHLPGGGGIIVDSVSILAKEKWVGRDCQLFVRVAKATLVQVDFHSPAITQSTGDDVKDQQVGRDCDLTDAEWSSCCGVFFMTRQS